MMASFELENDSFYICTEMSPRCYIVQKAIQIDRTQLERMITDREREKEVDTTVAPPPPILPYWFTPECRNELTNCDPPSSSSNSHYPPSPSPQPPQQPIDLRAQLKTQLEYYFSRENLITDRYLRCQMDTDQYVPISIIAGFRKIVQLTNDYNLILQVLRESTVVEVDERGEKVRPVCRRCTIILREVSEERGREVEEMLSGGPSYVSLKYGLNNSWYITFANEETTQRAYLHLQNSGATINGKPICARIKTGGPPVCDVPSIERAPSTVPPVSSTPSTEPPSTSTPAPPQEPPQYSHLFDLGQILSAYGFVPRATYRPGATVVHVQEEVNVSRGSTRGGRGRHNGSPRGSRHYQGAQTNGQHSSTYYNSNQSNQSILSHPNSNNNYLSHNGYASSYSDSRRASMRSDYSASRGSSVRGSSTTVPQSSGGRPRAFTTGNMNERKRGGGESTGRRRTDNYSNHNGNYHGNYNSNHTNTVTSPPLIQTTKYNGGGNTNIGPTLQIHKPVTVNEETVVVRNEKERECGKERERRHIDSEPCSEGPSTLSTTPSTTNSADSAPLPSRRERTKKWESADNERTVLHAERKNSESGRSGVSGVSGVSAPSTTYSFEEQSFPVLVEKKPEQPKPQPKPTFSFVAAGRRREKPEPKKSYAQTLRAPPSH